MGGRQFKRDNPTRRKSPRAGCMVNESACEGHIPALASIIRENYEGSSAGDSGCSISVPSLKFSR